MQIQKCDQTCDQFIHGFPAGGTLSSYESDWDICVITAILDQKQCLLYQYLVSAPLLSACGNHFCLNHPSSFYHLFVYHLCLNHFLFLISQARCWAVMTLIISMLKGSGAIWSGQSWKASCAIQMPLDFELVISFCQCLKGSKGSKTNNYQSGSMFWICLDIHSSEADIKEKLEISSPWGQSARHYKEKSIRYEAWVW